MDQRRQPSRPQPNEEICDRPAPSREDAITTNPPAPEGLFGERLVVEVEPIRKSPSRRRPLWVAVAGLAVAGVALLWVAGALPWPGPADEKKQETPAGSSGDSSAIAAKPQHPKRHRRQIIGKRDTRPAAKGPWARGAPWVFIARMSYSSDGKLLLVEYRQTDGILEEGETLKQLAVWDAETGREIWTLRDPYLAEQAFWLSGTHHVLFYDWNGQISVWDADMGRPRPDAKPLRVIGNLADGDYPLHLSEDGRRLMAGEVKLGTRVWDVTTGKVICYLNSQQRRVDGDGSYLSPDGKLALTRFANADSGDSALWDVDAGTILKIWKRDTKWRPRWFFPDGKRLLGEDWDGGRAREENWRAWDIKEDKLAPWKVDPGQPVGRTMVFTPDGKAMLILNNKGLLRVDTGNGKVTTLWEADVIKSPRGLGGAVAFSPDRTRLVVERGGCNVQRAGWIHVELWDATTGTYLRELAEIMRPD